MAEIRKIVRGNPLSNLRQAAPESGGAFRFLAGAMEEGYNSLLPAAENEMKARGTEIGRDIARQQIGDPAGAVTISSMGEQALSIGDEAMDALGKPRTGGNAGAIRAGLIGRGMPEHIADGFVMNFQDESGMNSGINEANPIVPGSRGGFGLYQLTGPRRREYEAFAADRGVDPSNVDAQLDFLMGELKGKESGAASAIFATRDAGQAAAAIVNKFLRPSEKHRASREARYTGGNVTVSTSGPEYAPPTMLMDADGKLTARLYSPLSGPLLQISNAAAGVAYQSDVMMKGMTDMLSMSTQFALDPEGYRQASTAYVDDLVKAAPEMFRNDVRAGIERVAQQRFLGMVEEKQRDIQQRASNSSAALADRWSDRLAQSIAGGNPDEIASARTELESVLMARERLPGIAWTREQSENTIIKSEEAAARLIKKMQDDQGKVWKSSLSLVSEAAMNGRTAADESILDNPIVAAMFPDEFRQAASSVMLRDQMPSFMRMTPAEQAEALADMKSQPVSADWEIGLYGAAESAAAANAKAWETDPIARAGEVMPQKPPELPDAQTAMENPQSVVDSLSARVAYANGLKDQGFVDFVSVLTDTEAETYGALMGKDTPPELRAMMAGAIVAAAGKDAVGIFRELKSDDPVTMMAGMLMARGGDAVTATMAMKGQAKLDEGLVQAPTGATTIAGVSPEVASALAVLPNSERIGGDTLKFATALWASQVPANGLDEEAELALMKSSVQQALGQTTNKRGDLVGGVQTVGNGSILLPPGMSGEKLNSALVRAFSGDTSNLSFGQRMAMVGGYRPPIDAAMWGAAGVPMLEGQPLRPGDLEHARLTPEGGNMYRLTLQAGSEIVDVATATGAPFIFDAQAMIDGVK